MTVQYRHVIRNNTPQKFQYEFLDQDLQPIDVSYLLVVLEIKQDGVVYAQIDGVLGVGGGFVEAFYTFNAPGLWYAQFYVTDEVYRIYGEPLELKVVENIDDLALSQIMYF